METHIYVAKNCQNVELWALAESARLIISVFLSCVPSGFHSNETQQQLISLISNFSLGEKKSE